MDDKKIDVTRILGSFKSKWKKNKAVITYTDEMTREEMADLNKDPELIQMALDYKKLEFRIMERIDWVLARSRGADEDSWPLTVNNPQVIPKPEADLLWPERREVDEPKETDLQKQMRKAREKVKYVDEGDD